MPSLLEITSFTNTVLKVGLLSKFKLLALNFKINQNKSLPKVIELGLDPRMIIQTKPKS